MGRINKKTILGALLVALFTLTGCKGLKKAQKIIDEAALNTLQTSDVVKAETSDNFNNFEFTAADFEKIANKFSIDISGIAITDQDKQALVNMEYLVESSVFDGVDENDAAEVIQKLAEVINTHKMQSFDYAPMESIKEFNSAMKQNFECPLNDYEISSGFTYAVDDIEFNEAEGYVVFKTRQNVKYFDTNLEYVYTITGTDSQGYPEYGYAWRPETDYQYFNQSHDVYMKVTPEQMNQMKNDKSLIFKEFIKKVNNKEKDSIVVQSKDFSNEKLFEDNSSYSEPSL